jgi:ATP-dependent DNA helicase RecQ
MTQLDPQYSPATPGTAGPDSAGLEWQLQNALHEHFHLSSFRKGQLAILRSVVAGRDTMAVMPTGGGKSLCYQLPAVLRSGLVVVVSPLVALMKDQVRGLNTLGIRAGCLYSGQTMGEKQQVFARLKEPGTNILYLSPERVQNPGFAAWIKAQSIVLFAIDEAHCVSQWGPDFREDYNRLRLLRELRPDVPILALTATATPQVLEDMSWQLRLNKPDRHVYGFYRSNLYYQVETCADDAMKFALLMQAVERNPRGRILIYCGTRQQTETLAQALEPHFSDVGFYHAGMGNDERQKVQQQMDRGEVRILAATNAFGMGIDYPDVRLVVHFQMPANIESFYQEMGRAGRDGQMSTCLLLYSRKDRGLQSFFISKSTAEPAVIRRRWNSLEAMTQFVEGGECRHAGILTYFRDTERITSCGHCDVCAPQAEYLVPRPAPPPMTAKAEKSKKSRLVKKDVNAQLTSPAAETRASMLRDWRKAYAKEKDIPAFMVFSDRTLVDLANKDPRDLSELKGVYGFGAVKTDLLGPQIIEELNRCR